MTTSEIFSPLILNALFSVIGCFATLGAMAVKELTVIDADNPDTGLQRPVSKVGRKNYFLLFALPPFIIGAIWGLIYAGLFSAMNEALSYAIAMILGIVANSFVLKLNGLSIQEVIDLIKNNFPNDDT